MNKRQLRKTLRRVIKEAFVYKDRGVDRDYLTEILADSLSSALRKHPELHQILDDHNQEMSAADLGDALSSALLMVVDEDQLR